MTKGEQIKSLQMCLSIRLFHKCKVYFFTAKNIAGINFDFAEITYDLACWPIFKNKTKLTALWK